MQFFWKALVGVFLLFCTLMIQLVSAFVKTFKFQNDVPFNRDFITFITSRLNFLLKSQ